MIYRILIDAGDRQLPSGEYMPRAGETWDKMWDLMDFKQPKHVNPRARFYFTELGWERHGKEIAKEATNRGYRVKIIKKKSPKKGDVVYCDPIQVAILPK